MQYQILQTNITRTVWLTVRRITKEILGVKGLSLLGEEVGETKISKQWRSNCLLITNLQQEQCTLFSADFVCGKRFFP